MSGITKLNPGTGNQAPLTMEEINLKVDEVLKRLQTEPTELGAIIPITYRFRETVRSYLFHEDFISERQPGSISSILDLKPKGMEAINAGGYNAYRERKEGSSKAP